MTQKKARAVGTILAYKEDFLHLTASLSSLKARLLIQRDSSNRTSQVFTLQLEVYRVKEPVKKRTVTNRKQLQSVIIVQVQNVKYSLADKLNLRKMLLKF